MSDKKTPTSCEVVKITFRAFDQTLVEYFVNKDDKYIHESLKESCDTYQIISKEGNIDTELCFQSIQTLLDLQKASV